MLTAPVPMKTQSGEAGEGGAAGGGWISTHLQQNFSLT